MQMQAEGIVIRAMDYGEGNKILTVFTKEYGKVGVMARGARKLKSRHAAISQLFTCGQFVLFKSGGGLASLTYGEIIQPHHTLRADLTLAAYGSYLMELTDRLLTDQDASPALYEQLKALLMALEEGKDPQVLAHIYELKLLQLSGVSPVLHACISCGEMDPALLNAFSVPAGGALCTRCRGHDASAVQLSPSLLKLLRVLSTADLKRIGQVELKAQTRSGLKQLLRSYVDHHLDLRLRSRAFLDQLEKYEL
ncbi:DNA repair protein RecO [Paenibacillus sp. y28]|uniref:DNA repair protein RecO n=1 Tax=Paenibacillus sp. y28 TaxID=3129110 RepID=UPI00301B5BAE